MDSELEKSASQYAHDKLSGLQDQEVGTKFEDVLFKYVRQGFLDGWAASRKAYSESDNRFSLHPSDEEGD